MLPFGFDTCQQLLELGRDVLAVRDDVQPTLPLGQGVEYSQYFSPLGGLVRPFGGPVRRPQAGVIGGETPASPGPYRRLPASPVGSNNNEGLPGCRLGPALGFPNLGTVGDLGPTVGHSPGVPQAVWELSRAFRLMAHAWACIDIVPSISKGVVADWALP